MSEEQKRNRAPTAVTIKENIIVLNVNSNRKSVSHGFLAGIFGTLDRYGVVVDLISTSEVHVSMAIEDGLAKKLLERLLRELRSTGTVSLLANDIMPAGSLSLRFLYIATWPSFPWWGRKCEIWSA